MPAQQIQKGTTYVNYPGGNSQVTAENLNDHVDNAVLLPGAISAQDLSTPQEGDYIIAERTGALFKYTLASVKTLFSSLVNGFLQTSGGTMTGSLFLNTSSPTAANQAASKGYVDSKASTAVPSGTIAMWGTTSPPSGWIHCAGQSTSGYPNLQSLFGTNVPDLRGEFVRGWDGSPGKGVDPGRGIRSFQGQDVQPHTHTIFNTRSGSPDGGGPYIAGATNAGTNDLTSSYGGMETRPRNVALMFIVKT